MRPIVGEFKPIGNDMHYCMLLEMLKTKVIHDIVHSSRINIATMSLLYLYRIIRYYEKIIKESLAISLNTRRLIN
ncbi:hypothetical protein T02_10119 [Trichinella nativa]|uniref:Uncharacterized protein n=1 Tax=Trichinella nativa TaxID=6335 RepID=A0A0V1LGK9_9BILA|nr:hypothetical protein T02_10119 [Trichinella nativa]